ncbi:MAG: YccF domain-containing protein [Eubacteriaceae bacterium]
MRFLGNIIWVLFGGFFMATLWFVVGIICCVTLIGIPLGVQAFKMAGLTLWPFGRDVDFSNMGTGSAILNVFWIILFGWELALASVILGVCYCVTVIGIPFGLQWFKFAKLSLLPFGAVIK